MKRNYSAQAAEMRRRVATITRWPVSRLTAGYRALPNFLIIGAQKAGTTALFSYLGRHPQVRLSLKKEVHYFDLNYDKGLSWYKAHFPFVSALKRDTLPIVTGESSPYYQFHPAVPQRCAALLPEVRLIVILRDPIERAYSHYQHEHRKGQETLSFEDALAAEPERLANPDAPDYGFRHRHYSYASRGLYAEQLERWFEHFPRDQFLILHDQTLRTQPDDAMRRVHEFIGVAHIPSASLRPQGVNAYAKMSPQARERLAAYFAEPNRRLQALLGESYGW